MGRRQHGIDANHGRTRGRLVVAASGQSKRDAGRCDALVFTRNGRVCTGRR